VCCEGKEKGNVAISNIKGRKKQGKVVLYTADAALMG
jgi:hypothetical protein